MRLDKQKRVLSIVATGRYKEIDGCIYSLRSGTWNKLVPTVLPSGYLQHTIYNGVRYGKGLRAVVYAHVLVYLMNNGLYPDRFEIDHIDNNNLNNHISNLRAVNTAMNQSNKPKRVIHSKHGVKTIRGEEIKQIREMLLSGMSQAAIARELDLNRLSVRYTIKRIESGEELKYENWFE